MREGSGHFERSSPPGRTVFRLILTLLAGSLALYLCVSPSLALAWQEEPGNTCGDLYVVQVTETLEEVAERCDTTPEALRRANPDISASGELFTGQELLMPGALIPETGVGAPYRIYVAQEGETLAGIARKFTTTVAQLIRANPGIDRQTGVLAGQRLNIPLEPLIPDTGGQGQLELAPNTAYPGETIQVTGSGFPAAARVTLDLGIANAEAQTTRNVVTDPAGRFQARLTVPPEADPAQTWVVIAMTANPPRVSAAARLVLTNPDQRLYAVQPGDSLSSIALQFGLTFQELLDANPPVRGPGDIIPGQVLNIPITAPPIPPTGDEAGENHIYVVQVGDTMGEIARQFGVSLRALLRANPQITNPGIIYPGQEIFIPPVLGGSG